MYRILTASKDTYITDKIIAGSRSLDSNVGSAATLDLFKLYDETYLSGTVNPIELSRILVHFDYSPLQSLTSSILNPSGSSFKAFLHLKSVYGGQTTPNNFTVNINPLAKSWDEGVGTDVLSFRDLDSTNWITASRNPSISTWVVSGASQTGSIGDNCDYYTSGNIGIGSQSLTLSQSFPLGSEDLFVDVSSFVSASIWGSLTNNGFRITFTPSQETDGVTRFVKRFGSRNAKNCKFHPNLIVKYSGNVISDDFLNPVFDLSNRFHIFNEPRGVLANFVSGGSEVTGSSCLILELVASKSNQQWITSWSQTHSQSITFLTTSLSYFSSSFTGSQLSFGSLFQSGIYYADVTLDTTTNSQLRSFVSATNYEQSFVTLWKSLDGTVLFSSGGNCKFHKYFSNTTSFDPRNYVVNITNLDEFYSGQENVKLRVFIQDWEFNFTTQRLPRNATSKILKNMYWQLIDSYTKEVVIPFDDIGTKLSSDGFGMFFDFWFSDLQKNKVYEFEFKIVENGRVEMIKNQGFRFRIA